MLDINTIILIIVIIMVAWYSLSATVLYRVKRNKYNIFINFLKSICQVESVKLVGTNLFVSGRKLYDITKFNIAVDLVSTDIIFLWITSIAFGRRDLIILKGEIEKKTSNEIEIVNLKLSGGRMLRKELLRRGWKEIYIKNGFSVLSRKYFYLNEPPKYVWRISIRNVNPPLLIMLPFKYYDKLKEIAKYINNLKID